MKDTFYFSHDYNARQDVKIKKLIFKHGMCGYGVFWSIVEDLYNNANALPLDYESITYELRIDEEVVKSVINDFDLFVIDGLEFGSKSIENRLNERNEKSKKARKSALARWNKPKDDANALQTQSDSNAIKERKRKEIKEKKTDKEDKHPLQIDFDNAFDDFVKMRKEIGKKITERGQELIKNKLRKLSGNNIVKATAILNQSIENSWQGVFELKESTPQEIKRGGNPNARLLKDE